VKTKDKTEKTLLENFFNFVNADVESLTENDFIVPILSYSRFLTHNKIKHDFLNFREKYDSYTDDLLEVSSPDVLSERKEFFVELQLHIKSRLQTIIDAIDPETPEVTAPLVMMQGRRRVSIDPNTEEFIDNFRPEGFKSEDGLDLNDEKALADLVFFDFVFDYNLKPNRFGKCLKCGNFFYQTTAKKKEYCSKRCSSAARQAKHYHEVIKPEREKGGKGESKSKAKD
jgi:hypothetical protein